MWSSPGYMFGNAQRSRHGGAGCHSKGIWSGPVTLDDHCPAHRWSGPAFPCSPFSAILFVALGGDSAPMQLRKSRLGKTLKRATGGIRAIMTDAATAMN